MALIAEGKKNKEIAVCVGMTLYVLKNYIRSIYDKVGCESRTQLALWWVAKGELIYASQIQDDTG